jgi:hypothetical protein
MDKELGALIGCLDAEREHVLGILEGLTDPELRRPVLPTGWNCLELVRHLTVDVERFWLRGVIAGEPGVADDLFKPGAATHWRVPEGKDADAVFADYRAETRCANAALAAAIGDAPDALDRAPAAWPAEIWPHWRLPDLRSVLLHVIVEVSCHTGHLDAARELIDGRTWLGGNPYAG